MNQLEEMKARVEEARPGPWEVIEDEGTVRTQDGEIMFDRSAESGSYWNSHGRRNAEFIAHARTDIPKLIAALEAVEALLGEQDGYYVTDLYVHKNKLRQVIKEALR